MKKIIFLITLLTFVFGLNSKAQFINAIDWSDTSDVIYGYISNAVEEHIGDTLYDKNYCDTIQFKTLRRYHYTKNFSAIVVADDSGDIKPVPLDSFFIPASNITSPPWISSYTEADPIWVAASGNYYTKTFSDARFPLLSGSYSNPSWINSLAQSKISYSGTTSQYIRGDGSFAAFPTLTNGTVTSIGLSSTDITIGGTNPVIGSGTISLTLPTINSNVGTFNNLTINGKGQVTSASNVSYLTTNQSISLSGDVSGSGTTSIATTLANSGATAGSYSGTYTVDSKGRITSAITKTQSAVTPSLNTAFQVSSSLSCDVNYSVNVQITSALTGTNTGTVQLQISSTSGGTYTTINQSGMSLAGVVSTVGATQNLSGFIPAGYWVKIATSATGANSGSAIFTPQASQQVSY